MDMSTTNTDPDMSTTNTDPALSSGKISFIKTCFNGINALSGVGLLSVPYALSQGGWPSLIVFMTIAIICFYTGLLLQRCIDSSSLFNTYPDIGAHAFGRRGRVIVATFMYLELYLVAIDFLILEGDNLQKLFPAASFRLGALRISGKEAFVLAATLAVLPTTWFSSLNVLAYVAAGGALASLLLIAAVLWVGVFDGVGFRERGRLLHWESMPNAMSLYSFCFSGHAVFPMIYTGMKDRKKVLSMCFTVSTLSYGLMGIVGYLMYGDTLKSQITLNLPSASVAAKVAIYTTLVNPLAKYALVVAPVAEAAEGTLGVGKSAPLRALVSTLSYGLMGIVGYLMYGDTLKSQITLNLPSASVAAKVAIYTTLVNPLAKYALVVAPVAEAAEGTLGVGKSAPLRALLRTVLVIGTAVVALAVPFFADVVGLTGALLSCTATMLLPCLCYVKVRSKIGGAKGMGLETAACLAIVAIGTAVVGLGTYSFVKQIVRKL